VENDTTKSYFSSSFRFHSSSIPFPVTNRPVPGFARNTGGRARIIELNPFMQLCEKSSEEFAVVKTFFIFTEELIFM